MQVIHKEKKPPAQMTVTDLLNGESIEDGNDKMYEHISEPQWSKENPIIIKGGKGEVTLVDYEPSKSCTNSLAISTCLRCGKCGRTFHAGKLTDDKVFKQKISYSNKIAILYPMDGGADNDGQRNY